MRTYVPLSILGRRKGDEKEIMEATSLFKKRVREELGATVETGTVRYYYSDLCKNTHSYLILNTEGLSSTQIGGICGIATRCGFRNNPETSVIGLCQKRSGSA